MDTYWKVQPLIYGWTDSTEQNPELWLSFYIFRVIALKESCLLFGINNFRIFPSLVQNESQATNSQLYFRQLRNSGGCCLIGFYIYYVHIFPRISNLKYANLINQYMLINLDAGSLAPGLRTGTSLWPVRNRATQQVVSGRQVSEASSATPHHSPLCT